MLMASDNMQFTVQVSAMMSMHYIYVRPTKFKAFFCSTKSTDRNAFSKMVWLHFQHDSSQIPGPMMRLTQSFLDLKSKE